ncbi:lipoxygenase family protein [Klebsormidium nitens]|uniref:Lipoxygenase family protein n=1 Tax=Klebsormidium nitens TaxID=105231 RepID=A0A1Y1HNQ7_KLENI|nr:lipoxygenase family protein [Klebsormidium nitens]|eukprot:GAQ78621.1 lipoxygenase family protein [Klebsormidium nitens]
MAPPSETSCSLRRIFWTAFAKTKMDRNQRSPLPIPNNNLLKTCKTDKLGVKSFLPHYLPTVDPGTGSTSKLVVQAETVPKDEAILYQWLVQIVTLVQWVLMWIFPLATGDSRTGGPVVNDEDEMVQDAFTKVPFANLQKSFQAPVRPPGMAKGRADIGELARNGPLLRYTQAKSQQGPTQGGYIIDLSKLAKYKVYPGLHRLGAKAELNAVWQVTSITTGETGAVSPSDDPERFALAKQIFLASAATYNSILHHTMGVHVAMAECFEIAARNTLSGSHPLLRLLWAHFFGAIRSNAQTIRTDLQGGFFNSTFESVFSWPREEIFKAVADYWTDGFDLLEMDPSHYCMDVDSPAANNLRELWGVIAMYSKDYLSIYYKDDEAVATDASIVRFLTLLNNLVPGGVTNVVNPVTPTLSGLTKLAAVFIWSGTGEHGAVGQNMWNYVCWTATWPLRVYQGALREDKDRYQLWLNYNYILNVPRASLVKDFSDLALDSKGEAVMKELQKRLKKVQEQMPSAPKKAGLLYPDELDCNIAS